MLGPLLAASAGREWPAGKPQIHHRIKDVIITDHLVRLATAAAIHYLANGT